MFDELLEDIVIHSVALRSDDLVEIVYSEKRHIHPWGIKSITWQFDRNAVPQIELNQMIESADAIISLVEIKSREEAD